ncbi:MAG: enoyl-CoA hydratase/isomerase family protein [Longimicrobiales bacterium]
MSYQFLRIDTTDEIATLSLSRAPANLLNIEMVEEMNDVLLGLRARRSLEVLIIRGTPECFSDGFDLNELGTARTQRLLQVYMRLFETLRMMDLIEIAAVEGRARGAGFEVALGCNLLVAAQNATFALPETSMGLFPPIAVGILPRIAPRRKAMEWILTGNEITAAELHHHGLINRLLPEADFDRQLQAFAAEITEKSGPVLALAKRAQFEAYYSTFPEAMSRAQSIFLRDLMELEDAREGVRARLENRKPQWKNK